MANKIQREIPTLDTQDSAFSKYVLHADAAVLAAMEEILVSVVRLFSGKASTQLDQSLAQCFAELLGYQPSPPKAAKGRVIIIYDPERINLDTILPTKLMSGGMTFSIQKVLFTVELKKKMVALVEVEADRTGSAGNLVVGTQLSPVVPVDGVHNILANEDFTEGADALDAGYLLLRELHLLRQNVAAPPPVRALAAMSLPKVVPGFWHKGCFYVTESVRLTTKVTLIPVSSHGTTILEEGTYLPFYEVLGVLDGTDQEIDYLVKVDRQNFSAETAKVTLKKPEGADVREHVLLIARAIPDLLAVHCALSRLSVPVRAANLAILRVKGIAESAPPMGNLDSWCTKFLQQNRRARTLSIVEIKQALSNFGIDVREVSVEHLTVFGRRTITGEDQLVLPDDVTVWVYDNDTFDFTTTLRPAAPKQHTEVGADTPV